MRRSIFAILIVVFCLTLIVVCSQLRNFTQFKYVNDAESYIAMVEGRFNQAYLTFARRVLHPWVVSILRPFAGTDKSFLIVGTISLFIFFLVSLSIMHYYIKFPFLFSIILIFVPPIFLFYRHLYLQILFFLALSSLYWLFLVRKQYVLSLLVLSLLLFTREEAIIISLSFIFVLLINYYKHIEKRKEYFVYIFTTTSILILVSVVLAHITRNNKNMYNVNTLIYLFAKVPLFGIKHFIGFEHWFDVYKTIPTYVHPPLLVLNVPHFMRNISVVKQFGIYEWDFKNVMRNLSFALSSFGIGPTIVSYFLRKKGYKRTLINCTIPFQTILLYGPIQFILSPFVGDHLLKYYFFSYPLFFIIMPFFLLQIYKLSYKIFLRIIVCYILSSWMLFLTFKISGSFILYLAFIAVEVILHWYTLHNLLCISRALDIVKVSNYEYGL